MLSSQSAAPTPIDVPMSSSIPSLYALFPSLSTTHHRRALHLAQSAVQCLCLEFVYLRVWRLWKTECVYLGLCVFVRQWGFQLDNGLALSPGFLTLQWASIIQIALTTHTHTHRVEGVETQITMDKQEIQKSGHTHTPLVQPHTCTQHTHWTTTPC